MQFPPSFLVFMPVPVDQNASDSLPYPRIKARTGLNELEVKEPTQFDDNFGVIR